MARNVFSPNSWVLSFLCSLLQQEVLKTYLLKQDSGSTQSVPPSIVVRDCFAKPQIDVIPQSGETPLRGWH